MTEKITNGSTQRNGITIKRLDEKSAIVFYELMRSKKKTITYNYFVSTWRSEWGDDFKSNFQNKDKSWNDEKIAAYFQPLYESCVSKWKTESKESMKAIRMAFLSAELLPAEIKK